MSESDTNVLNSNPLHVFEWGDGILYQWYYLARLEGGFVQKRHASNTEFTQVSMAQVVTRDFFYP